MPWEFLLWNAVIVLLIVDVIAVVAFSRWINKKADALIKRLP